MASPADRLRNPAHTGPNRCLPCTAVNVGLATAGALIVATVSIPLAVIGFAVAIATIALRGYLVPGTPRLTARYLPDRVLAWTHGTDETSPFVTGPARRVPDAAGTVEPSDADGSTRVDGAALLVDAGVLAVAARESGLHAREPGPRAETREARSVKTAHELTAEFRSRASRELDRLPRAGTPSGTDGETDEIGSRHRRLIAELFEASPSDVASADRPYPAITVGHRIRGWPSPAALRVDLATHTVLDARTDRWRDVPVDQRVELLEAIRSRFDRCPDCDGAIAVDETPVESCCVASTVATHRCASCGARLLEYDPGRADLDGGHGSVLE